MQSDHILVDSINKRLNDEYRVLDGRPIYRIVWSDEQLEMRKGTFTDWYGHILIRQEHNIVRQVKKYWYYEKPCWVLEKLVWIHQNQALKEQIEELVESRNGTYEPVYSFYRHSTKQALPVAWRVVDFIVDKLHNPTRADLKKQEAIEEEQEVAYFEEELGKGERSPLFVAENAAFVSSNQMTFKNSREPKLVYSEPLTLGS